MNKKHSLGSALKHNLLWVIYGAFVVLALLAHTGEPLFLSSGPLGWGKPVIWGVYLAFLAYSIWVSVNESFYKALGKMKAIKWSWQVGVDLYLGVALFACVIYLNEGSVWVLLMWLPALMIYANLATLLYLALNYQSLIDRLIG